jgi:hypothetical protein
VTKHDIEVLAEAFAPIVKQFIVERESVARERYAALDTKHAALVDRCMALEQRVLELEAQRAIAVTE